MDGREAACGDLQCAFEGDARANGEKAVRVECSVDRVKRGVDVEADPVFSAVDRSVEGP